MKNLFSFWKKYAFIFLIIFIIFSLFDLRFAMLAIVCMVAPLIVSIFKGRFWCGNLCPRGNFYDNIMSKFSKNKRVPKFLKSIYFRGFVVVLMMSMFAIGINKNWGNLYGIGLVFYRMIVITTIIGIGLALIYSPRTWCHFCPMGTIASVISKFRKSKRVLAVSSTCVSCKLCEKKCPMGIVPYDYKENYLSHPDCIQCRKCVYTCPKDAIGYKK